MPNPRRATKTYAHERFGIWSRVSSVNRGSYAGVGARAVANNGLSTSRTPEVRHGGSMQQVNLVRTPLLRPSTWITIGS